MGHRPVSTPFTRVRQWREAGAPAVESRARLVEPFRGVATRSSVSG